MTWQTFSDSIYLALLYIIAFYILLFCNIVLILMYQSSRNGCHTLLHRCLMWTYRQTVCPRQNATLRV